MSPNCRSAGQREKICSELRSLLEARGPAARPRRWPKCTDRLFEHYHFIRRATMENPAGLDFANGVPIGQIPDGGMLQGKAGEDDVIIARCGDQFFAVGAS